MKSRSTKIWSSFFFALFDQKKVGKLFCEQYPDDRAKEENVSKLVDKCIIMFVMDVFQGNVNKK